MRLYFDCCCYNRPFDDQSRQRIYDESEAILSLINRAATCGDTILDSSILRLEIERISEPLKKAKVQQLHRIASEVITYAPEIRRRAEEIRQMTAIHEMDSLHLASAEFGNADVFLTTDMKLLKSCRNAGLHVRVMNPVSYLAEVIEYDGY